MIKEFKPALMFLGKFLAIYFAGNILYGVFIEYYKPAADPATKLVAVHSATFLQIFSRDVYTEPNPKGPTLFLKANDRVVLSIYEGCNGINVMIVFFAFVIAFSGKARHTVVFIPIGLLIIHLFNLFRVALLYLLAESNSRHFYYYHKYFFTATLYLIVFALWIAWVFWFNGKHKKKISA